MRCVDYQGSPQRALDVPGCLPVTEQRRLARKRPKAQCPVGGSPDGLRIETSQAEAAACEQFLPFRRFADDDAWHTQASSLFLYAA